MSEQILSAVHGVTTMLFGIYCSAFFLGIKPIRKNILTMFLLFSGQGLLYVIDLALFGETLANMSYPLIVHFPLVLFLSVHYKYKGENKLTGADENDSKIVKSTSYEVIITISGKGMDDPGKDITPATATITMKVMDWTDYTQAVTVK